MSICEDVKIKVRLQLTELDHPYAKLAQKGIDLQLEKLQRIITQHPHHTPYHFVLGRWRRDNRFLAYSRYMAGLERVTKELVENGVEVAINIQRHRWRPPHIVLPSRNQIWVGPNVVSTYIFKTIDGKRAHIHNGFDERMDGVYVVGERSKVHQIAKYIRNLSRRKNFNGKQLNDSEMKHRLGYQCILYIVTDKGRYVVTNAQDMVTAIAGLPTNETNRRGYDIGGIKFPPLSEGMKAFNIDEIPKFHPIDYEKI